MSRERPGNGWEELVLILDQGTAAPFPEHLGLSWVTAGGDAKLSLKGGGDPCGGG